MLDLVPQMKLQCIFLVPGYIGVHCCHPVAKHNDSHNGGWYQELSVNTEPCEVQTDLLAKVLPVGSEVRDQEVEVTDMMTEQTMSKIKHQNRIRGVLMFLFGEFIHYTEPSRCSDLCRNAASCARTGLKLQNMDLMKA